MKRCWLPALLMLAILIAPVRDVPAQVPGGQPGPMEPLAIHTSDGKSHAFRVEIARTPEEQARGLMFRKSLAADAGMLFLYTREEWQAMWMKNTLIPLDMLFIREDGRIFRVHERAVPGSLDTISSRGRVLAVLELRGGTAARLGIKAGDRVEHAAFAP